MGRVHDLLPALALSSGRPSHRARVPYGAAGRTASRLPPCSGMGDVVREGQCVGIVSRYVVEDESVEGVGDGDGACVRGV